MAQNTDAVTNTGPGSEQIRAKIERTRANMDETFDALEAKLTPGQLLGEVWSLTKGGSTAGASKLWRVAREYPMPSAVIGLGLGWLLVESSRSSEDRGSRRSSRYDRDSDDRYGYGERSGSYAASSRRFAGSYGSGSYDSDYAGYDRDFDSEAESGRLSRAKDKVSDVAHNAKESVSEAAHSAKETVSDAAHSAREAVSGAASNVREKASDVADRARSRASELKGEARWKARQARTGFWQMMESNPLAMGAATLALGVLAGLAIPSTRKEDELLGETRDHLVEDLKERGQEVLEKGRHVAESTMETVKQVAQDEGLTVEGVAEKVRNVGREVKNKVKEEVENQDLLPGGASGGPGKQPPAATDNTAPSAPSAAVGAGTGNFDGGLGGGGNTPSPTVGGTPGERMGSAGGPAGAREEEHEPELLKR